MKAFHYQMPEAEYHAWPALSAGGAWTLATECPALYWHRSPFNPNAECGKPARHLDIGTALHLAALEQERFYDRIEVVGADDWRTQAARDARDRARETGKVPLLWKDQELIEKLHDALRRNKHAAELLHGAATEVSYFWDADSTPCKARADVLRDDDVIADLKSSTSAAPEHFRKQAWNFGHFMRVPFYCDGYEATTGKRIKAYWFIVVSTEEPHLVTTCRLDDRAIEWGRLKIRRALTLFRECMKRGVWPPYEQGPVTLSLPSWAEYRLADEEQEGRFDPAKITGADVRRGFDFLAP